jgi:hypothetical protein
MPFWADPVSTHTEAPVAHEVLPVWQGFAAGVQTALATHARHWPPLQTSLVPQDVPSAAAVSGAPQVRAPAEHDAVPIMQAWLGVQLEPATHWAQVPLRQKRFVPHEVPSATRPLAVQTAVPDEQTSVIRWHEPAGVQSAPALQAAHDPWLQTAEASAPASQAVPFIRFVAPEQLDVPAEEHANAPSWH